MKKALLILFAVVFLTGCTNLLNPEVPPVEENEQEVSFQFLSTIDKLQGKWQLADDEKVGIEFSENAKIDYYDNEVTKEDSFIVVGENGILVSSWEGIENEEYRIDLLDMNNLQLSNTISNLELKYIRVR